jgi:hypothetical protein
MYPRHGSRGDRLALAARRRTCHLGTMIIAWSTNLTAVAEAAVGADPSFALEPRPERSTVSPMGEPIQGNAKHNPRLDDALAGHPDVEEETVDAEFWDQPAHDGVVTSAETDVDRRDLRSEIGTFVSTMTFPVDAQHLIAAAETRDAPDRVLERLRRLDPRTSFRTPVDLWDALDLGSGGRF